MYGSFWGDGSRRKTGPRARAGAGERGGAARWGAAPPSPPGGAGVALERGHQLLRRRREVGGEAAAADEVVDRADVLAQHHRARALDDAPRHVVRDEGVGVAVAAHPRAEADDRRHADAPAVKGV